MGGGGGARQFHFGWITFSFFLVVHEGHLTIFWSAVRSPFVWEKFRFLTQDYKNTNGTHHVLRKRLWKIFFSTLLVGYRVLFPGWENMINYIEIKWFNKKNVIQIVFSVSRSLALFSFCTSVDVNTLYVLRLIYFYFNTCIRIDV